MNTKSAVRVRFAPSPTGRLHVGNIRTAIINWLFAHRNTGEFLLRLDDTDRQRSTEEYAAGIRNDLSWLGLAWDMEARQSDRMDNYALAVARLKAAGRLYPCFETAEELELKRKLLLARGKPPIYDRAALKMSDAERAELEARGRKPHWRFLLEERTVVWDDLARGESHVDVTSLSDPVLIRDDGSYLYTLPSVVDDVDFTVTHVIRGEDHVTNTAAQIQLFEALEAEPPQFAHHNLLTGTDGQTLSKRLGSLSIEGFRKSGLEPLAVVSHAATIGSSEPVAPHFSMDEMADLFDFTKLSHAPARFDERELFNLNAKFLHAATFDSMKDRLAALGLPEDEELWEAVHGNIERLKDIKIWQQVIAGEMKPVIGDARFCRKAAELLPPEPWDEATWEQWVSAVKSATGAKGRALFMPLRQAITGMDNGPELKKLLPMIGRKQVIDRLSR